MREPTTAFDSGRKGRLRAITSHSPVERAHVTIVRGVLSQLKGGDIEYPLQPQRQDRAGRRSYRWTYEIHITASDSLPANNRTLWLHKRSFGLTILLLGVVAIALPHQQLIAIR